MKKFHEAIQRRGLTLNDTKSVESKASINILGYCVGYGFIKPDQERLRPLQDYPTPTNVGSLRRVVSMVAYYATWIPNFFDKIHPLVNATFFPLDESALSAFYLLKKELERATLQFNDEGQLFEVKSDASEVCVSATQKPMWTTCCIYIKNTPR